MKNYLFVFMVFSMLSIPALGFSQLTDAPKMTSENPSNTIEGLSVFPNPVSNGKLYISTKYNLPKTIEIYDVLGKQVIATLILGESLNISRLSPGIYILKIKENELSATRKLVVR
ncbi:T9SS type A sorting domain-containing protein [Psychroserpens mesophilus]|uniref:T9SS type A sorting domain-containing protein n=1 Tax=Psychroserpens mesophilus TaxID=325473 RepID=UPI003D649D71